MASHFLRLTPSSVPLKTANLMWLIMILSVKANSLLAWKRAVKLVDWLKAKKIYQHLTTTPKLRPTKNKQTPRKPSLMKCKNLGALKLLVWIISQKQKHRPVATICRLKILAIPSRLKVVQRTELKTSITRIWVALVQWAWRCLPLKMAQSIQIKILALARLPWVNLIACLVAILI